jgi:hypothetical protein
VRVLRVFVFVRACGRACMQACVCACGRAGGYVRTCLCIHDGLLEAR